MTNHGEVRRALVPCLLTAALALGSVGFGAAPVGAHEPGEASRSGTQSTLTTPSVRASANPLAAHPWGVYSGPIEQWYEPWLASTGEDRVLLDKIATQPKAAWFGSWVPDDRIYTTLRNYIETTQAGDPNVLVQFTVFRISPWSDGGGCDKAPDAAYTASYRAWVDSAASAVADTYAAVVIQPDSPFATQCAPKPKKALSLIRYATAAFAALPNTSVYVETGSADWMHDKVENALKILIPAGVELARGFAFNGTHYDSTARNVRFGAAVAKALARRGIKGKHFVINTAQNGAPFQGFEYGGNYPDNARVCKTDNPRKQHLCVTLGIPPTTDVANPRWGLTQAERSLARRYADAYLWFGRPWLYDQNAPFVMSRALWLARTTPFQ